MASITLKNLKLIFPLLLFFLSALPGTESGYSRTLSVDDLGLKTQTLTHIRVYFHEKSTKPNATMVRVAPDPTSDPLSFTFGAVNIVDDPVRVGPSPSSKRVGRAQLMAAFAAQDEFALLMAINLVFTEGRYNGSSITMLGRNAVFQQEREMPVVGGTGAFRFATGYTKIRTYSSDLSTGVIIVEYNVYVLHY